MSIKKHRKAAGRMPPCRAALLVVSDRITPDRDISGSIAERLLARAGHAVVFREIVPNDRRRLSARIRALLRSPLDLIVTLGGTGISARDISVETVSGFMDKELPGFGELFRRWSTEEIGTASVLSRAVLGMARGKIIVSVPGSPEAVRLAMGRIVLPELGHLLSELRK